MSPAALLDENRAQDVRLDSCGSRPGARFSPEPLVLTATLLLGAILGLSAPGFNQWYLCWFGLVPLLWLVQSARNPLQAFTRGWSFGTGYNLVYMCWYFAIRPVFLVGTFRIFPEFMQLGCWLLMGLHQGLLIGIFSAATRALPMAPGWLPDKRPGGGWLAPSFLSLPLLWILIVDKLGNAPQLLGVPWTQLQYSQYQQLPLLQCASIIGGMGICALLVLVNATIFGATGKGFDSRKKLVINCLATFILVAATATWGTSRIQTEASALAGKKTVHVSALQANMVHRVHTDSSFTIARRYIQLAQTCKPGICVWPEWSLVCNFTQAHDALNALAQLPQEAGQSWICGVFDKDAAGRSYNAVCALDSGGHVSTSAYHKRRLVPFGEFTPDFAGKTFLGQILYGSDPNFEETAAGNVPVTFKLAQATAGPILCFENLYPDLVAATVRSGSQIIVDCSNTSWFNKSVLSDQMVAFSVMRAVENHRPFVFASALGPSTIIDAVGHIKAQAPREAPAAIAADVAIENDQTLFTRWCW